MTEHISEKPIVGNSPPGLWKDGVARGSLRA
jgi:hypothetical protein